MLKKLMVMGVFILLLVITISSSAASFSTPSSQEDISIETIEKPFLRNVTDITHSDDGMVYVGTDGNGLVKYDTDDNSFEVLNTTSDFPTDKIDYVKWCTKNEELYFSNFDPEPYPENESIIPYAYSLSEDENISPIGNRGEGAHKIGSIEIFGQHLYIDGYKILVDFKNQDMTQSKLFRLYYRIPILSIYYAEISEELTVGNGYIYNVFEVHRLGGVIAYTYIGRYPLKNVTMEEYPVIDDHNPLGGFNERIFDLDINEDENLVYVSTNSGIFIVNSSSLQRINTINKDDGLISNITKYTVFAKGINTIFTASDESISIINLTTDKIFNLNNSKIEFSKNINCIDWNEERSELYIGHDNVISILTIEDNTDLPKISHTPVTQATVGKPIPIDATITDASDILSAQVYYRPTDQVNFTSVEMQADGDDYTAQIPATPTPGKLEYYIEAVDMYGNENQTEVYEVNVVKESTSTQAKDGYIPGTDMTSSVIITAIIVLIAVLFVTFFYYSKAKRKE